MGFELGLEMDSVVLFSKLKSGRDLVTGKRGPWVWPASGCGGEEGAAGGVGYGAGKAVWPRAERSGPGARGPCDGTPSAQPQRVSAAPHPRPSSRARRCLYWNRVIISVKLQSELCFLNLHF